MNISRTSIGLVVVGMGYIHITYAKQHIHQTTISEIKTPIQKETSPIVHIPIYSFEGYHACYIEVPKKIFLVKTQRGDPPQKTICRTRKKKATWRLFRLPRESFTIIPPKNHVGGIFIID